ncbi:MAG: hypothetical protein IT318_24730 [Anaerolineales bacterium]|nr:hypothetical protein [Anaerolineales bacterium]
MRRLCLLLLSITLAACSSPAPAAVTPIMRQISAQEAGAIIIDATNTAAAVATSAALATATEISARATSTAVWHATQDSLTMAQTMTALDLTRAAGQAAATEAAGVKTQAAGQTATWGPPTLQAVATAAAATQRAAVAADAAATAEATFRQGLRQGWNNMLIFVSAIGLLAILVAVAFGVSDILKGRAELLRAEAERGYAQARQLLVMQHEGHLLQRKGEGWVMMALPQLAAPGRATLGAPPPSDVREVPIKVRQEIVSHIPVGVPETPEREKVLRLLRAARDLVGGNARHVPSAVQLNMHPEDWQAGVDLLKPKDGREGYIATKTGRPKAGEDGRTKLVHPQYRTLAALLEGVQRGDVLPPPPDVAVTVSA